MKFERDTKATAGRPRWVLAWLGLGIGSLTPAVARAVDWQPALSPSLAEIGPAPVLAVFGLLAAGVAGYWALAVKRKAREQAELLQQQLQREAVFSKLSQRLSTASALEETGRIMLDAGDELIGWDASYVHLFTPDGRRTIPLSHHDLINGRRTRETGLPATLELTARDRRTMEHGAELILRPPRAPAEPGFVPFGDCARPSASLLFAPLRKGTKVIGVVSLQAYALEAFDAGDLRVLQNLADLSGATFERIQAETALKESEERFRSLIESSPVGIAVSRENGLLYANQAHQRMFGYADFSELDGKSFFDLIAVRDHQMVKGRIARRQADQRITDSYETIGRRRDGSEFDYHVEVTQLRLVDGEATVAFLSDITERKRALDELRESEERFARVFHATPVAVSLVNAASGRLVDVNEAFLRLFELRREQVIGATAVELNLWADPAERERMVGRLERHRSLHDYEARFRTASGERRDTLISVEPIQLSQQECLLFITHDITDRLNLESQLRHVQKMDAIGQLAAGVAHDFNNILTVIQGHMSLLTDGQLHPPETAESLAEVVSATGRAASLTRQLLTFSRKQVMQPQPLDLDALVRNTSRMLHRLLGENITIQVVAGGGLPQVQGDPGMMEQILVNLAVNARDAMPNGGQVTIETRLVTVAEAHIRLHPAARAGEFVRLSLADTGCGMDAETRSHIFEPFFTTKEVGKGTGLGLATVYGIVKQHQGWIEVVSEAGQGSEFRVYLPGNPRAPASGNGVVAPAKIRGGTEKVLVVEDEEPLRELVLHVLKRYGYQVVTALHGRDALRVWETDGDGVSLLLTDMVMPEGVSGWELARALKARNPALKVIFTSGYSAELFGENCELREGVNFLPKPFLPQALARAVRDCLDGDSAK
jgi:two-component system cell cycle sensor histidine kinase/response regulator CckA